jgi:hypothetical protein
MSSTLKIAASRANGAKSRGPVTEEGKRAAVANSQNSTGPVTPEGKARVSQNATRHGLLADSMVLDGESEDRFSAYLSCLELELQPEPGIESSLVEIIAVAHWRRMRLWSLEKVHYSLETAKRLASAHHDPQQHDGETPITHLARSFRSLSDESRALELLNRYETRYSREFQRALACLKNHQIDKRRQRIETSKQREPKQQDPKRKEKDYCEEIQAKADARAKTVQISKQSEPNIGKIR